MSETDPAAKPKAKHYDRKLDVMNGVYRGLPDTLNAYGYYGVMDTPHVHPAELTVLDAEGKTDVAPGVLTVFVSHGYEDPATGDWVLKDGRRVADAIEQYNASYPEEPVQFAAVCNPTEGVARKIDGVGHAVASDIRITGAMEGDTAHMTVSLSDPSEGLIYVPDASGGGATRVVLAG